MIPDHVQHVINSSYFKGWEILARGYAPPEKSLGSCASGGEGGGR